MHEKLNMELNLRNPLSEQQRCII